MLDVNITYHADTRLMEIISISTGDTSGAVATTGDDLMTELVITIEDLNRELDGFIARLEYGVNVVDSESHAYRPFVVLGEIHGGSENVFRTKIPQSVLSSVKCLTLPIQLAFIYTDENLEKTELYSLNTVNLAINKALDAVTDAEFERNPKYGDAIYNVTFDSETSTIYFSQFDGSELQVEISGTFERHFEVYTRSELVTLSEARDGDTATTQDTGLWYVLYGPYDILSSWNEITGGAIQNGTQVSRPIFYAPEQSGDSGQYLESRGAYNSPEWVSKVTDVNYGGDAVPTATAVKEYTDAETTRATGVEDTLGRTINDHIIDTENPHNVTKAQVGLGSVTDAPMDLTPTENSDNYVTSGGVYSADAQIQTSLDSEINTRTTQFNNLQNGKRDKISGSHSYPVAYTQDSNGQESQTDIVSNSAVGDSIVARTSEGTIVSSTPQNENDVAIKSYVDGEVNSVNQALTQHKEANNPHNITKTTVGLSDVENYPMDPDPTENSENYVTSGGVYTAITSETTRATGVEGGLRRDIDAHINTRSGNPHDVTKSDVHLGDVENYPMDLTPTDSSLNYVTSGGVFSALGELEDSLDGRIGRVQSNLTDHEQAHNPHNVNKVDVGLGNVENEPMDTIPDANSTHYISSGAVYTVNHDLTEHITDTDNPHNVTKTQLELDKVDNTSDYEKPISYATQSALDEKVDKLLSDPSGSGFVKVDVNTQGQVVGHSLMDESDIPTLSISKTEGLQNALDEKAPTSHSSSYTTYGVGSASEYGHVKMDTTIGDSDRTDTTISESGIRAFVNSSISTNTSNYISDNGNPFTDVNDLPTTSPPVTNNDYAVVVITDAQGNKSYDRYKATVDEYGNVTWALEYEINSSEFTAQQWASINSGMSSSDKTKLDTIQTGAEVNVQSDWNETDPSADDYIKNKPTIPTIPNIQISGTNAGTEESGKYLSSISASGHTITVTKASVPSLSKGTTTGPGNVVSDISVSGHTITLAKNVTALTTLVKGTTTGDGNAVTDMTVSGGTITLNKGTTFLTAHQDISGKMNTDMSNINISGTKADGKTVVWDATNTRWTYGEAGKVDDVKVNNVSVVTNKIANITVPTVNNNKIDFKDKNGTIAQTFTANQSSDVILSFEGSGGTTVTADATNKKFVISTGTIPTVNNGTLTIKLNGTSVGTFTANQSGNTTVELTDHTYTVNNGTLTIKSKAKSEAESTTTSEVTLGTFTANQSSGSTIKIPIPTKVSDLDNDTGFITGLSFSQLSSHPNTIAGYGITDAKIDNGVITLGSNTITPITDVSGKADKSTTVTNVSYNSSTKKIQKTINGSTTDVVTLATVATSGSYNDLSNKPTITDTKVTQVLKSDNYDRPLLMSDQIISTTTESVTGEARRNNSIYANTSTGKITSTLISATQVKGGLTKTYEIQATGYKTILQMKDATTYWTTNGGHSFVRYLIEYSTIAPGTIGTTGMKSGSFIVDSVFSGVNGGHRITSMNANAGTATGVMRYFRAFSPKSTSYCPQICVALQDATTKVYVTVTILSASDGWQLPASFGGDPGTTNYNQWSAEIGRYNCGWESVKLSTSISGSCDGTAGATWDSLRNDRYVFGESAVAGSIMAMATDGRMYKLRNGANKEFTLPLHCGRCTGTFTYNGSANPPTLTNYAQIMWNMRSQSYAELTNTNMQGTAFVVPTLTAGQYGLPLYITGALSNGNFVPDGNIVTAMVNNKTNVQIGRIDRANTALNAVPTLFTITGYAQNAYTLDSNGKLTHIDGKEIKDADTTSVPWGNVTSKPFASIGTGLSVSNTVLSVAYGTSGTTACAGNDSRLSNARTPTAHAVNANTYGYGDTTNAGHLRVGSNITVSNGTISLTKTNVTTALGYTPPTQDTDTWIAMVGATSSANGSVGYVNAVPPKDGYNTKYLRADGTWTVPPYPATVSKNGNGLCPALPNETTTTKFLRQDGSWAVPSYIADTDCKTSSANKASTKLFLIGAETQSTNNTTGATTQSNSKCYIGTDNCLYSNGAKVLTTWTTVNNATLKIQKNGTDVASFTANASTGVTANITVPTKVSDLSNDSGFVTTDTKDTCGASQSTSKLFLVGRANQTTGTSHSNSEVFMSNGSLHANSLYVDGGYVTSIATSNTTQNLTSVRLETQDNLTGITVVGQHDATAEVLLTVYGSAESVGGGVGKVSAGHFYKGTTEINPVSFSSNLNSGKKIGTITIGDTETDIYCNTGTVTPTGTITANQIAVWNANGSTILKSVAASSLALGIGIATDTGGSQLALAHGGKYKLTVGGSSFIFTMPSSGNTDTKVRQNIPTDSTILSTNRPLLLSYLASSDTSTGNKDGVAYRSTGMYANISTNTITATGGFIGNLTGNSATATALTTTGQTALLKTIYPVGSIYMNASNSTNPATLLGFGTWTQLAPGRVLMGAGTDTEITDAPTYTAGDTVGEYSHTLSTDEMPTHGHGVWLDDGGTQAEWSSYDSNGSVGAGGTNVSSWTNREGQGCKWDGTDYKRTYYYSQWHNHTVHQSDAGGGGAHNNVQPSLVVYMWVRTA